MPRNRLLAFFIPTITQLKLMHIYFYLYTYMYVIYFAEILQNLIVLYSIISVLSMFNTINIQNALNNIMDYKAEITGVIKL